MAVVCCIPPTETFNAIHSNPITLTASVGLYAIQLAANYGFEVVTTCSTKHIDLVRSHGATHVFDYRRESAGENIRAVAPNLKHAFDTIGKPGSSATASRAFREGPGNVCTVRPGKANTQDVLEGTNVTDVLVWTAFLKDHNYGEYQWPVSVPRLILNKSGTVVCRN